MFKKIFCCITSFFMLFFVPSKNNAFFDNSTSIKEVSIVNRDTDGDKE